MNKKKGTDPVSDDEPFVPLPVSPELQKKYDMFWTGVLQDYQRARAGGGKPREAAGLSDNEDTCIRSATEVAVTKGVADSQIQTPKQARNVVFMASNEGTSLLGTRQRPIDVDDVSEVDRVSVPRPRCGQEDSADFMFTLDYPTYGQPRPFLSRLQDLKEHFSDDSSEEDFNCLETDDESEEERPHNSNCWLADLGTPHTDHEDLARQGDAIHDVLTNVRTPINPSDD